MIYLKLFWTFFKIGLFTFGGGYAMLPLIQAEVLANRWMENAELINFVAVSESTPGPFAINISTYIGSVMAGPLGSLCSTFGVVLPSFLIILLVAKGFERFQQSKIVRGCMAGLKPAVIGMIGSAILSMGTTIFCPNGVSSALLQNTGFYVSLGIFLLMIVHALKKVHPILLICISAVLGIAAGYLFNLPV